MPQLPPEFQPNVELTSPDESVALMEVKQMLGTLTTALMTTATKVDKLSQGKGSHLVPMSAQPGTRAGGKPWQCRPWATSGPRGSPYPPAFQPSRFLSAGLMPGGTSPSTPQPPVGPHDQLYHQQSHPQGHTCHES